LKYEHVFAIMGSMKTGGAGGHLRNAIDGSDCARSGVEMLGAAIDVLASDALSGRLGDELVVLERLRARLDAQISRRLERFDRSLEFTLDSHRSAASWLADKARVANSDAYARVKVARQVRACERVESAWERGAITTRHVEVLARARHAAEADDEFAEFESAAVEVARVHGPEVLASTCRTWREALDADRQSDPSSCDRQQQFERRGLHASATIDNVVVIDGVLDPATGETVRTALDLAMDDERVTDDPRSLTQLRADALGSICEHFLSHREPGTNRPHLVVGVSLDTLAGREHGACRTEGGVDIPVETVGRWACDSIVQRILTADGIPLDLGRATRTFSPSQHRAMAVRDGGCRWPGCNKAPRLTQGHHVAFWGRDEGPTDLDNGALLCRWHHRLVHEGRHWIQPVDDPDRFHALEFFAPGGRSLGVTYPRGRPVSFPTQIGREIELARARVRALVSDRPNCVDTRGTCSLSGPRRGHARAR
jgi:Domain of unknown function (DUF222)